MRIDLWPFAAQDSEPFLVMLEARAPLYRLQNTALPVWRTGGFYPRTPQHQKRMISSSADTAACCGFDLLHQFISRLFCVSRDTSSSSPVTAWEHLTLYPAIYFWTSFGSHSCEIPFRDLPDCLCFFHFVKMSPPFHRTLSWLVRISSLTHVPAEKVCLLHLKMNAGMLCHGFRSV